MINLYYDLKTGEINAYNQAPVTDEDPPEGLGVANIPDGTPFLGVNNTVAVLFDLKYKNVAFIGV